MTFRRLLPLPIIASFLLTLVPAPVLALSTPGEVQMGKDEDQDIRESYTLITDPLLNGWTNDVSKRLWAQVARKDVPYNIKIIDQPDVNAFSTMGGYVYINLGALDFAQSDDELASIIGHETGHIERRHAVTLPAKAQALDLLFGIASLFSPFMYRFGQLAEAGVIAKMQRTDELQADQYGLLLMSRAGYDPEAMVTFMRHLGAAYADHDSFVDKYFADHPGEPDRVSHLLGYKQLDPKIVTEDQRLVAALHDQQTARYAIAGRDFTSILKDDPSNSISLLHLGQSQVALGEPNKGEQTLALAAEKGTPETRTAAMAEIKNLRANEEQSPLMHPSLAPLRAALAAADTQQKQTNTAVASRRDAGRDQLKALDTRLQSITYGMPDFSRIDIRKGSRLETVVKNIETMGRAIDMAYGKSQETIGGVGTLDLHKESGLIKENADILKELNAPLALDPIPVSSLALFSSYPKMLDDVSASDGDMIRALDASRSSLALLDVGLGDLDTFIKRLAHTPLDFGGDVAPSEYNALVPLMATANDSLNRAGVAGAQASQLFNLARSRQLVARITLLGVGYPQDRYATLQYAIQQRVKNDGLDYATMTHEDLTPGDVAAASIIAADTNTTPQAIVQEAKSTNKRIVDVANARGMSAEALEIFLGLVYLDYTDDPVKEAANRPS